MFVCVCDCLLVISLSPAKTEEPIEMPFGLWTWVCPRDYVLGGDPDPRRRIGNFGCCSSHSKIHCNRESAESGLYTGWAKKQGHRLVTTILSILNEFKIFFPVEDSLVDLQLK